MLNLTFCNIYEHHADKHPTGAEIELSMLFADVRGSMALAESVTVSEFTKLIDRAYTTATQVLIDREATIDKLASDQVAGLFAPRLLGPKHVR